MQYFILAEDRRFINSFRMNLNKTDLNADEAIITSADFSENTVFNDFYVIKNITDCFFFVSDRFKLLLSSYTDRLQATPCFFNSNDYTVQKTYWRININELDFPANPYDMRDNDFKRLGTAMENQYIAKLLFEKQAYIVVSLHIAENVLRKRFYGIKFVPVLP